MRKPITRQSVSAPAPEHQGLTAMIRKAAPKALYAQAEDLGKLLMSVRVQKTMGNEAGSNVGEEPGEQPHPFDFRAASRFKIHNVHHSTCIRAKTKAMVGLGHVRPEDFEDEPHEKLPPAGTMPGKKAKRKAKSPSKVAEKLDPLCKHSWQHTLTQLAEDFWQTGNCYLEVVKVGEQIMGLHWLPSADVTVFVEDKNGVHYHFVVKGRIGGDIRMSNYGDVGGFLSRNANRDNMASQIGRLPQRGTDTESAINPSAGEPQKTSEVIHIAEPSTLDRWYGVPQWLASGPLVELVQALHQHQFDFHNNRGVPEFLMIATGGIIPKKVWNEVTNTFDGWTGIGNSHRASAFNFSDPNLEVEIHKLAMEGIQNGTFFRDMSETLSTTIVSAHGVPPSLAGILIPGKMGASNESTNALTIFQTLEMGPEQEHFETMLGTRLGAPEAGLDLTRQDFELRTIIEEMAEAMELLKPADTMGKMKQQLPDAAAEGRDLKAGVKKTERNVQLALALAESLGQ